MNVQFLKSTFRPETHLETLPVDLMPQVAFAKKYSTAICMMELTF